METEKIYQKFLVKYNDNYETSKIAVDRGRFVIIFNESEDKMIQLILDSKRNDELRYIQKILVKDFKINRTSHTDTTDNFLLPENYFDFSSAYTLANKENCENKKINLFEIKDDNITEIISDEFNKPSFLAREAPFTFANNNLVVFKENFKNNQLFLSYYRYPTKIKLLNEEDPESLFDESFQCEFDEKFIDRILSMATSEMKINDNDQTFQINKLNAIQKT